MSNEWYTPAKYIEAAREVMGSIDLDPASCELANQTVRAAHYYSKEDDGLSKAWYGNVWLNPPYGKRDGRSYITLFVRKLIHEFKAGNIRQAVLLTTCRTDSAWFKLLWDYPLCFASHYVTFHRPDNLPDTRHMSGSVFVYLGPHEQKFVSTFSQFGRIAKAVDTPVRSAVQQLEMVS